MTTFDANSRTVSYEAANGKTYASTCARVAANAVRSARYYETRAATRSEWFDAHLEYKEARTAWVRSAVYMLLTLADLSG